MTSISEIFSLHKQPLIIVSGNTVGLTVPHTYYILVLWWYYYRCKRFDQTGNSIFIFENRIY